MLKIINIIFIFYCFLTSNVLISSKTQLKTDSKNKDISFTFSVSRVILLLLQIMFKMVNQQIF